MRSRLPKSCLLVSILLSILMLASGGSAAAAGTKRARTFKLFSEQERARSPEDRYALAGGCYSVLSQEGRYVSKTESGFEATVEDVSAAEPFHFQATDLGRYLMFGSQKDFLAVSEGLIGEAAYTVTESTLGATAGGVAMEKTDAAADELARSQANREAGRGESIVAAAEASELADWKIDVTPKGFSILLPATDQALSVDDAGNLLPVTADAAEPFTFELHEGCASFPESMSRAPSLAARPYSKKLAAISMPTYT